MWSGVRACVVLLLVVSACAPSSAQVSGLPDPVEGRDDPLDVESRFFEFGGGGGVGLFVSLSPYQPPLPLDLDPLTTPWALLGAPLPEGVLLKWNRPLGGEPDAYRVYRSVDGGAWTAIAETEEPIHFDAYAWDAEADLLAYSVTALYSAGGGQVESGHSNVFVVPGFVGDCRVAYVYGAEEGPVPEYGINPSYLECLLSGGDADAEQG